MLSPSSYDFVSTNDIQGCAPTPGLLAHILHTGCHKSFKLSEKYIETSCKAFS